MRAIYKYKIKKYDEIIDAPVVHWLHVDWQDREHCFCAWALIDDEMKARKFNIKLIETGEHFRADELDGYQYICTVNKNLYVAHFFAAELDPETLEVKKEDKEFDFTFSPEHMEWLNKLPPVEIGDLTTTLDWTYRPEMGPVYEIKSGVVTL